MEPFSLMITGSRSIRDAGFVRATLDAYVEQKRSEGKELILLVSGNAMGVDRLAERWAKDHSIPIKRFEPQWQIYGKRAALLRNTEMAQSATHGLAIWDGKSVGTKHAITQLERMHRDVKVVICK